MEKHINWQDAKVSKPAVDSTWPEFSVECIVRVDDSSKWLDVGRYDIEEQNWSLSYHSSSATVTHFAEINEPK